MKMDKGVEKEGLLTFKGCLSHGGLPKGGLLVPMELVVTRVACVAAIPAQDQEPAVAEAERRHVDRLRRLASHLAVRKGLPILRPGPFLWPLSFESYLLRVLLRLACVCMPMLKQCSHRSAMTMLAVACLLHVSF